MRETENYLHEGLSEVQKISGHRVDQVEGRIASLAEKLEGALRTVADLKVGVQSGAVGAPPSQDNGVSKLQVDLKVLGHIVRQMQEAMIQNSPGVQKMEVLLNQAKVELNRDLSKKGDRIKHEVQKTVEKITLEQEQKMEARLKALEKMHDK